MTASQLILSSLILYMFNVDIARRKRDLKHKYNFRNFKFLFPCRTRTRVKKGKKSRPRANRLSYECTWLRRCQYSILSDFVYKIDR